MLTGAGLGLWYQKIQEDKEHRALEGAESGAAAVGAAAVGGPFTLTECVTGKPFTEADLKGRWNLLYFGFTACPDVCPEELEKIAEVTDGVQKLMASKRPVATDPFVRPVFITVDPRRDTRERVAEYVAEFHPAMIGLTGTLEQVRQAAHAYRVYFSQTSEDNDGDYLVDHSIISYLVDPNGEFVAFYGKNVTAEEMIKSIVEHSFKGRTTSAQ